eukprot:scaffold8271_cov171-Amphora_coffeaeformis.AAC.2
MTGKREWPMTFLRTNKYTGFERVLPVPGPWFVHRMPEPQPVWPMPKEEEEKKTHPAKGRR